MEISHPKDRTGTEGLGQISSKRINNAGDKEQHGAERGHLLGRGWLLGRMLAPTSAASRTHSKRLGGRTGIPEAAKRCICLVERKRQLSCELSDIDHPCGLSCKLDVEKCTRR